MTPSKRTIAALLSAACFSTICAAQAQDVQRLIEPTRQLRMKLLKDPYRPTYHIVATEGSNPVFDANGAIFWKGRYHLMYLVGTEKGLCWAHISSIDLVHWRHHPLALEAGGPDKGINSGGMSLDKNGVPTIAYWGIDCGICLATSTDENLDHWTKSPHNPVIRETQCGLAVVPGANGKPPVIYGVADPTAIWINQGHYYLLTGNKLVIEEFGQKRKMPELLGDRLYLFVSDDLIHWKYLHPFYESDRKWTKDFEDNMCPDFFPLPSSPQGGPLSGKHMILFIAHPCGCQYYLGRYANDHFYPDTHGRMSWVDNWFFAPESLVDAKGRRIMWAWIFDAPDRGPRGPKREQSGWSGEMSLPRVLWLGADGQLCMQPAEELQRLRCHEQIVAAADLGADEELVLPAIAGNAMELLVEIEPRGAKQCGVNLLRSPDGKEQTAVYYNAVKGKLEIDLAKAGPGGNIEGGPFAPKPGEKIALRIFIDKSIVEVFANDRQAVMRRVYTRRADALGVSLFAKGGAMKVRNLHAWEMAPANAY
jgi:beta-fructofuranosidase